MELAPRKNTLVVPITYILFFYIYVLSKMLAIAEHWLRKELDENRRLNKFEKAQNAHMDLDPTERQGGYASGRNIPISETNNTTVQRQGRLSDMMGNPGVMAKHS